MGQFLFSMVRVINVNQEKALSSPYLWKLRGSSFPALLWPGPGVRRDCRCCVMWGYGASARPASTLYTVQCPAWPVLACTAVMNTGDAPQPWILSSIHPFYKCPAEFRSGGLKFADSGFSTYICLCIFTASTSRKINQLCRGVLVFSKAGQIER